MSEISSPLPTPLPSTAAPGVALIAQAAPRPKRDLRNARRVSRHLRAIRLLLNGALLLALVYTITIGKTVLIPLVLAGFIGLALNPIVAAGARFHLPRWLTACVVMIALGSTLTGGVVLLSEPALNWFHQAPAAIRTFAPKIKPMTQQLEAASRATQSLIGPAPRSGASASADIAVSTWDILSTAPRVLASVLTVALLVFFFLIYGDELLRRAVEVSPTFKQKRHTVTLVRSIQIEVSSYLLLTAAINTTLGAITAGMLWLYGVPDPLLWGTVAAMANFIPYVGAITTTTLLSLVGLLHFPTIGAALLPALTFAGITAVEGNLVTPLLQGRRMRLSPVAILLWLLIWGWLWGIPGALLAVPMLTTAKLVTAKLRGWEWFAHIVGR